MKIVAICGSPRNGNTYKALNTIKDSFPETDLKIIMLKDQHFELCKGCYTCVVKGEGKCPLKDDRDMILNEMKDARGVIFSSPAYCHMVSAMMKNFFDRFGYLAHRPQFFGRYAMSLTTVSGYGAQFAIEYMDKMAKVYGFEVAPSLDLNVRPGKQSEDSIRVNKEKTIAAFKTFISKIDEGKISKPSLQNLVPFHIFKLVAELQGDYMTADREYYKDKINYYFDTKISPIKTKIAKKLARKEILK